MSVNQEEQAESPAAWSVHSFHNRGAATRWVVCRGGKVLEVEHVANAFGRAKRFRSEAAAQEVADRLNGPPTHWMDDRGLTVTDEFLKSSRSSSDWRDAYKIPCVMLDGRPYLGSCPASLEPKRRTT